MICCAWRSCRVLLRIHRGKTPRWPLRPRPHTWRQASQRANKKAFTGELNFKAWGAEVRGGRGLIGMPIDFQTGQSDPGGKMLGTENLGVALLKLGGLDTDKFLPGIEPLNALLADPGA